MKIKYELVNFFEVLMIRFLKFNSQIQLQFLFNNNSIVAFFNDSYMLSMLIASWIWQSLVEKVNCWVDMLIASWIWLLVSGQLNLNFKTNDFKLEQVNCYVNINHMNNSYLFFKKPKPNKPTKQLIANSNKSITAKLNHSLSASSNHSNYNKSQSKTKKQNIVLTKRQREIRDAIQYRFQKSKLKKFSYNCYANKRQQNLSQIQCQSSNSSQEQEFKTMKKLTIVNLYQYHENKLRYQNKRNKQDQKYRQKLVYQKNARQKSYQKNVRQKSYQKNKRQQSQSPTTKNVQSRFKIKSNVKSDNSNNSLNKNIRSIKDIYMNSILSLANKNTVKNQQNKNYLSQKKNDLSLKQKINKIEKLDKTAKNASDWKSIFVKLKDSKSSLKDNKNIYSYRQNIKSPKTNKYLIEHGTVNTTQYAKNVKSFKNINYSEQRKKGDLYKVKKQEKNIQLDIDSDQQYGEERLKKNLSQLKKQHSKQIKKILQRQYKGDIKYK